jgi:hypothetical protein
MNQGIVQCAQVDVLESLVRTDNLESTISENHGDFITPSSHKELSQHESECLDGIGNYSLTRSPSITQVLLYVPQTVLLYRSNLFSFAHRHSHLP